MVRIALVRFAAAMGLAAALITPGTAVRAQGQTVDLRLRLIPGQVHRYSLALSTGVGGLGTPALGLGADLSIPFDVLTLVGNPDGSGILVITFGNPTISTGGDTQPVLPLAGLQVQETLDANGQVTDVQVTGGPADQNPLGLTRELFTSGLQGRLQIGQTVETETDLALPQDLGTLTSRRRSTLTGFTEVDGAPAAQIETSVAIPSNSLEVNGVSATIEGSASGTSLIDVASGWARSAQVSEDLGIGLPRGPDPAQRVLTIHLDIDLELVEATQVRGK